VTFSKLGTDNDTGQIVELSQASRRQGLYIIGANGTGKTGLIEHLILQDIDQGLGVGLLDPHGDLVNAILAKMTKREDDVILLDIQDEDHPFGLNIFECSNPQSNAAVQKIVDLVMHIFEKLYDVNRAGTPLLLDYLRNCTYTLVANPGYTMADIPLLFTDQHCRQKLLANISEPYVKLFWQQYEQLSLKEQRDEAASTMRRVREFLQPLSRNIVGQAKTTVNMQQIMDERKILLVKLSAQLDQVTSLIGSVIIAMILNAAYSRASLPVNKRKQFNLYADEFQRFATEDFATLLTEARKFGIATTIAHQARYQPGMTDGIRAVSLQAANHVVFRVTSPDADELAGGFDVSPQAAWEEEIAKEWVEVLKPEWYERVEEEVIDGEEEIQTVVSNISHLVQSGKTHPHPKVNQFFGDYFYSYNSHLLQYNAFGFWDGILYQVMRDKDPTLPIPHDLLKPNRELNYNQPKDKPTQWVLYYPPSFWLLSFSNQLLDDIAYEGLQQLARQQILVDQQYILEKVSTSLGIPQTFLDLAPLFARHVEIYKRVLQQRNLDMWSINTRVQDRVKQFEDDRQKSQLFLTDLREVMRILAVVPILEGSGVRQPRKRKQINYHTHPAQTLTHPRKVIMHPQRTYQDVRNDIANQLSGLPNFTARVKTNENVLQNPVPQNPGKKCLKCKLLNKYGANYCQGCGKQLPVLNEYTFTTLKPLGGLGKAALQQRLTTIQANNIQQRYVRDRTKVEAEIIKRQTSCSSSAPTQPQKPQHPTPQQRHARQVPVQGKCHNCGASNSPGSKFCNQCGTQL
jgi:hypothetical protein